VEDGAAEGERAGGDATLAGRGVIVTAGGTREPIDPVRYLGNRSSGKMGNALALAAARMGAHVTLITTVEARVGPGVEVVRVDTADEMHNALRAVLPGKDVLLMAAAVADYRPATRSPSKLKKRDGEWLLALVPSPDILASLRAEPARNGVFVVGFAAETDDLLANAQRKLRDKGLDLIVLNDVGRTDIGMGTDDNEVTIIDSAGIVAHVARAPKPSVADAILRVVAERLRR
jgi:phosphopantothenoylcysteine decarboxylase/phosphopantothenate--cysteine ligase